MLLSVSCIDPSGLVGGALVPSRGREQVREVGRAERQEGLRHLGCHWLNGPIRLSIIDCQLSIADCRLPIVDCRLPIVDYRLQIADCRLSIVDCRSSIVDYRLQISDCRLSIADCRLSIANGDENRGPRSASLVARREQSTPHPRWDYQNRRSDIPFYRPSQLYSREVFVG